MNLPSMTPTFPRFSWDYAALDAFQQIGNHYLAHERFQEEIGQLNHGVPDEIRHWTLDSFRGLSTSDPPPFQSLGDIFLGEHAEAGSGSIKSIDRRYSTSWDTAADNLGDSHPWLTEIAEVAKEYGLLCNWGAGFVLEMVLDCSKPPNNTEWSWVQWDLRREPSVEVGFMTMPPTIYPGMPEGDWNAAVEDYRREGVEWLSKSREVLKAEPLWTARIDELHRYVEWLARRIIPVDGMNESPIKLSEEFIVSLQTFKRGCRTAAKLLGIKISSGMRGRRTKH